MTGYSYSHIWINGRKVLLKDITELKAIPQTAFEESTFTFIQEWCSGKNDFELQTSGSTGMPKKIVITRAMMCGSADLTRQVLKLQPGYNALVCLDTRFIAGKMMLVRSFETRMKIFAVDPCANPLVKIPVDQTIHFAALVPLQIRSILESKHPHLLDTLLTCIIGGAPLEDNLHRELQRFACDMYTTYGMTETVSHIALQKINGNDQSDAYHTLPGVRVGSDERGCLVISAPYLNEKVVTNDIAEVVDARTFRWMGRADHVINTGGIKVSPETLEQKIGQIFTRLHISNQFFIHSISDDRLGQRIVLVVEGFINPQNIHALQQSLLHSFSPYEAPKDLFATDKFILTDTGKINRKESFKQTYPLTAVST